jgi:hypothetical protein
VIELLFKLICSARLVEEVTQLLGVGEGRKEGKRVEGERREEMRL